MEFLRKYNVATHIYIPIVKRAVVDFAVSADWTPAAGDVKISKDGGAAANVTNLPTAITMGNTAMWDFSMTATEMQAAKVMVSVADAATKAVEDQFFVIATYGNASAEHAVDLDDSVRAGLTALPNAAAEAAGGLYTRGSGAGQINQPANGVIDTRLDATSRAAVVDEVWDEDATAHQTQGAFGQVLGDSGVDTDSIWGLANNNLDATVSSRLATAGYTAPDNTTIGTINSKLGAFTASGLNTVLGFFRALMRKDAALTPSDVGGTYDNTTDSQEAIKDNQLDAAVSTRLATAGYTAPDNAGIAAILDDTGTTGVVVAAGSKTGYALTVAEHAAVADKLLGRTRAGGADGGRTVAQCLAFGRNRWAIAAGVLTVYADDDTTPLFTAAVTTAPGDPVTQVDPA